ncbi:reprolysin-like metallopeptidase [[Flexibacter] sp. ATCC 35103]|uniref:zinc-dependent metalloprotease n=1 Tax=[Flexibacter] sp. ATCC 35103 TaxID=1937528 RepID=UPI0009C74354|nr:zinc-dependent metalloprotease family protein [[Flexibacter] sp. ATCC 35103]OMQ12546.1 propanediol utilization protein [[Flexibacter] sp. ATCC 35103]
MKKNLLFLFFIFCCTAIHAQGDDLWQKVSSGSVNKRINESGSERLYYKLNTNSLKSKLSGSTGKSSNNTSEITIPNSKGILERFKVWESSNFEPELQAKYPEIRSYEGIGLDDKTARINFSVAPIGLQTMVLRADKPSEYIEQDSDNQSQYVLSAKNDDSSKRLSCKTTELVSNKNNPSTSKTTANNKVFKTMRLALSCTGEYTAFFGGTKAGALAGMNASLTRVNGLFNRDLALKLVLIANTEDIIYTNAATDPYSNANAGTADYQDRSDIQVWNVETQNNITSVIGEANYDIGHLFGASGGGGNAGCIGCVCNSPTSSNITAKGSGYTSPSDGKPQGDTFDIDFVAHEMGHQLGATHTFSYSIEGTGTSVEPGSGSTIMGYAGITDYDVQANSDAYFAYASILQIQNNLVFKSCPVNTAITNNPPTINAGLDYTIPISTPFVLTGTGSNPANAAVTYAWEQNDNATTTSGSNSIAYATKPDGPLFRSIVPGNSPVRYMPALSSVIQNTLTTTWESVSSVARTLHFTLTARDNGAEAMAQTNTDAMIVNVVANAGPFTVTSQNTNDVSWQLGSFQTVTWSVNNTNTLQGSANVNIKLSIDGGLTFPIVLASNTANDGSEVIQIPTSVQASTNCRLLIEPTANIYYAVNSKSFAVGYTSATTCDSYSFGNAYDIPFGNTYTTRTVNVPASTGSVSDVNVMVNVTHARLSDLELQIVSPKGTIVNLYNRSCGSISSTLSLQYDDDGTDLDCSKTISQIVVPVDALRVFNGEDPKGTWTFRVRDAVAGNFGKINSASLNVCNQTFTLGEPNVDKIDFTLYPNPNKGNFTIQFESDSINRIQIFVYDILGKNIYSNSFDKTFNFNQNIQLSNVSSGFYFVTILDGDRRIVKKIIIN